MFHKMRIVTSVMASLMAVELHAQTIKIELFDRDGNGLDANERKAALCHQASAYFRDADGDYDGRVSETEKNTYHESQIRTAENLVAANEPEVSKPGYMTPGEFAESGMVRPSVSGEYWPMYGLQIRRSLADIDRARVKSRGNEEAYLTALKTAKSAEFGFSNNSISGNESWSARGVIGIPIKYDLEDGAGGAILPSLQFDRVTQSKATIPEISSLIFGVEASYLANPIGILATSRTSLGAEYGTTFDLDDGNSGGKIEWEPTFSPVWLGNISNQTIFDLPIFYATRQYLHAEGGHAEATATRKKSEYLRFGIGAGFSFYFAPGPLERLSLNADYRYYEDLTSGEDEFENFRATAEYRLDERGHFNLQAAFENGMIALSHQKVDLFTLGFGVKF